MSETDEIKTESSDFRCGYVALAGRPNVGKSSLLNALLKTRLSIVSPKAQTTRHRILGINHYEHAQLVYMDLPGIHQARQYKELNKLINRTALQSSADADVFGFVIQSGKWTSDDEAVLQHIKQFNKPVVAIINKIDLHKDRIEVLPFIAELQDKHDFAAIIPVSALKKWQVDLLEEELIKLLPQQDAFYSEDQLTDRSSNFYVTEIVREALFYKLQKEIPYGVEVKLVTREETPRGLHFNIDLWIAKASYKSILLGKQGAMLTEIREMAERNLEKFLQQRAKLHFHIKLVEDWSTHASLLQQLGYEIGR